jgi:rsbT co-antagonist protein RsbR
MDAIDTQAADLFARIIRAAQLLGTECLVCGIQPSVAQTMTSLGAGTRARTFGTMRSALASIVSDGQRRAPNAPHTTRASAAATGARRARR